MMRKNKGTILLETLLMFLASGVITISLLGTLINYLRMESRFYDTIRYTNAMSRAFGVIHNDMSLLKKMKACNDNYLAFQIKKGSKTLNISYYFEGKTLKRRAKEENKKPGINSIVELRKGGHFEERNGLLTIQLDDFSITYNLEE